MALFTDISWWNGAVDFAKMRAAGASGVIIRAGSINNVTGIPYTDFQFERNADLAPQYFDFVATYWFMRLNHDIHKQADYWSELIYGKHFKWHEPDIEVKGDVSGLFKMTARMESNLPGIYQVIYTNPNTWLYLLTGDRSPAINYDLHEAHWDVDTPMLLEPWKSAGRKAVIHQFSSEGNGLAQIYGAPPPPYADSDMDLNWVSDAWLKQLETDPLPPEPPLPEPPPEVLKMYHVSPIEGGNIPILPDDSWVKGKVFSGEPVVIPLEIGNLIAGIPENAGGLIVRVVSSANMFDGWAYASQVAAGPGRFQVGGRQGLPSASLTAPYEDHTGMVMFGENRTVYLHVNPQGGQIKVFPVEIWGWLVEAA